MFSIINLIFSLSFFVGSSMQKLYLVIVILVKKQKYKNLSLFSSSMTKSILITGGTGFIGSNLARELIDRNFTVNILIRKASNIWRLASVNDKIILHNVDLCDKKKLTDVVHDISPDYIFHLATYGAYPRIETDDKKMLHTNIIGTYNLLKATLDIPYTCFVNTGSSSEYGIKNKPMKESDVLEPHTFYGVSKATASMICQNYAKQYKKPITTLRPFSVYGYYEESFRLIPEVVINCINQKDVNLSSGEQKRDFIFIEDMIDAYVKAMENPSTEGLILNVGSGRDVTVMEVAETIHKLVDSDNKLLFGKKEKAPFETNICWKADIKAIKRALNWRPKTNLADGLKKTISWFKENINMYGRNL